MVVRRALWEFSLRDYKKKAAHRCSPRGMGRSDPARTAPPAASLHRMLPEVSCIVFVMVAGSGFRFTLLLKENFLQKLS